MNSVDAGILAQAVVVVETPPRDPLPDGTVVGPYRIRSLIASGGMGDVYWAHDERLGRDVALKVLPAGLTDDAERLERFAREAITIYDIGQARPNSQCNRSRRRARGSGRKRSTTSPWNSSTARRCASFWPGSRRWRGGWKSSPRPPRGWEKRMRQGSSIGTSSRTTSWSPSRDTRKSSTSAWLNSPWAVIAFIVGQSAPRGFQPSHGSISLALVYIKRAGRQENLRLHRQLRVVAGWPADRPHALFADEVRGAADEGRGSVIQVTFRDSFGSYTSATQML